MNLANLNKPIDVFYPFSWYLTNMYAYMTYSGPMPIMYLFGTMHWFLSFLCYKFLFVWYNAKPIGFDETLPMSCLSFLKGAVFMHLLFNLFMFTNKRILTPAGYTTEMHFRPRGEPVGNFFARRFDSSSSFMVFFVFIVVIVVYLIYKTILVPINNCRETRKKALASKSAEDIDIYDHQRNVKDG